ncbi:MAG TPA: AMP-binding protein [Candidatus Dormibacteraeota bacterium]|nr:AMP-binding protein [Candidatus Dormibacteraeota bacterium]
MRVRPSPGDLVAVALPQGPAWAEQVARCWEAGAALLPVDPRLPAPAVDALLRRARPTLLVEPDETRRLASGLRCDPAVAAVVATSGSTGEPRLVELDRAAVTASVGASAVALGADAADGWLSCLTPAHVGGLLVLYRAVVLGCPLVVHGGFDVDAVAGERGCVYVSLAATMLVRLLDTGADLGRFRTALVGGSAMPAGLAERAAAARTRAVATYGLTESCGGVVYDGLPLPGVGVAIGEGGEVELSGPTLMRGYRGDPTATGAALAGGRLRTGDAGRLDGDGRLWVEGRIEEVIVSGGVKIWPAHLEAVLRDHPGVADVAVTGAPDALWGERVVAVVVPADPAAPPSLDELRDHAGARVGRHQAPRELRIVEALPRTALGKVRRAELR